LAFPERAQTRAEGVSVTTNSSCPDMILTFNHKSALDNQPACQ
jgi:hypothetical protein